MTLPLSAYKGCRLFLIDLTQADVIGGTIQAFGAANPQGEIAQSLRNVKTAFVRRKLTEDDHFYETTAVNQGYLLRAFDSMDKAVE